MPTLVPQTAQPSELGVALVASPVSATAFGRVLASQLAFLLGRALPQVACLRLHALGRTASAVSIPLQWRPSPGCRLGLLVIEPNVCLTANALGRSFDFGGELTVTVTVPAGASVLLRAPSGLGAVEATVAQQPNFSAQRARYAALISLGDAGAVAGAIHDIVVTIDDVAPLDHSGLAQITLLELPVGGLAPELGEVGLLLPSIDARNDLHDGDSSIGSGLTEALTAEQDAATRVREHVQIATYEDTARCWTRSSASQGAIDFVGSAGSNDPWFRVRVRNVYGAGAATPAAFTLRTRYRSSANGTLYLVRRVVGSGATATATLALPSTGGAWSSASGSVTLRADGTDQQLDLQFQASTVDGSTLFLSSIALIQTEVP